MAADANLNLSTAKGDAIHSIIAGQPFCTKLLLALKWIQNEKKLADGHLTRPKFTPLKTLSRNTVSHINYPGQGHLLLHCAHFVHSVFLTLPPHRGVSRRTKNWGQNTVLLSV